MCWSNCVVVVVVDWLVVVGSFVTVDVVGGEVAVGGIGGESVIVKNPVPENNCFLNPRIFVLQTTYPSGTCCQNRRHGTSRIR